MILLIDNYDSFSYNLYQLIGAVNPEVEVIRNDAWTVERIEAAAPELIVLSPGPGRPSEAGICIETVKKLSGKIPILGVCLGHQAICEAMGAEISYAKQLMHGKQTPVRLDTGSRMFAGMEKTIQAARYHSLSAVKETLPEELQVTAASEDGEIMAVEHRKFPVYGVQFHPESVMTPQGIQIIKNILSKRRQAI
ncbi:anthranilate synthase component II [Cuneatibacter caecimuris]|uniref:Anthranilate synthase component 2 n=1 Tax=Cuneatibacter caecimuris TaxID=1796618 RepID=A0A4Q7P2X6_9FIRM|nr:aminodeoxychorismate/anthranilate synthase component II [Cuneatibacter caecimuris]RZS94135.1 anthranilate synthase component 2 [Cuneatibacter caecimuris]